MPGNIPGWTIREADKIYTPETLYDYIDGGAELYISYGMKEVASRVIVNKNNEIRIEIFDMTEPKNAFGVFSHTRTCDEKMYGQGSQYFTGAQIFWKNKYFIAITANDENESIVQAIQQIAAYIDSKITSKGEMPGIISLLPENGLERDGYIYFHHYIWLNSYHYIANTNFLNIGPDTDALLAKYHPKEKRCYLLLIKYPEIEDAKNAEQAFRGKFIDPDNDLPYAIIEDRSWIGVETEEQYLIAVLNAADKETVIQLMQQVKEKL
jgi:hypothetical protein